MKYVVEIANAVYRDIDGIRSYIAKDKPSAAKKVVERLYDAIARLTESPLVGFELKKRFGIETNLRGNIVRPYIILFEVSGEMVIVYRVIDGRRDYLTALGLTKPIDTY